MLRPKLNLLRIHDRQVVAMQKLQNYGEWLLRDVMESEIHNTVIVVPIEHVRARYRDRPPM